MEKTYLSQSAEQTKEIGKNIAKAAASFKNRKRAAIICLKGDLGGGKTTFTQGFLKGLGIEERILSPTFVILKRYAKSFYHIDCYRLKSEKDLAQLGFESIISDPKNIVLIEWPQNIWTALPKDALEIEFEFINESTRKIKVKNKWK